MPVLTASGGNVMPGPRRLFSDFMQQGAISLRAGGAAAGATGTRNVISFPGYGNQHGLSLEQHILGAGQTLIAPVVTAVGLDIGGDQVDDEGMQFATRLTYRANCPGAFKVGTDQAFYLRVRLSIADVSGTDDCAIGFRKAEAFQAAIDDYDEMACINVISGDIKTETILNNAATTTTDSTVDWADAATKDLLVKVSAAGVVTFWYSTNSGASWTQLNSGTAFTFDNGEEVVPFIYFLNAADLAGAVEIIEFDCGLS